MLVQSKMVFSKLLHILGYTFYSEPSFQLHLQNRKPTKVAKPISGLVPR